MNKGIGLIAPCFLLSGCGTASTQTELNHSRWFVKQGTSSVTACLRFANVWSNICSAPQRNIYQGNYRVLVVSESHFLVFQNSKLVSKKHSREAGEIFNVGYENHSVLELANTVKKIIGNDVKLESFSTNDNRSYHISSAKIKRALGFESINTISEAVNDLKLAFQKGLLPNSLTDEKYFNIKRMKSIKLN